MVELLFPIFGCLIIFILISYLISSSKKRKIKNVNLQTKKDLYTFLTDLFIVTFCVIKFFNMGWRSIIFGLPIILYIILFSYANKANAKIKNKSIIDHFRFWLLSLFFLLSALTFVDYRDTDRDYKILNISSDILYEICNLSVRIVIMISILSIIKGAKQKKSSLDKKNNK